MKIHYALLMLLSTTVMVNAQVIVFEEGDTTYQVGTRIDSTEFITWEFKNDLPKGKYWAVSKSECGVDTLAYAEFIVDGIKHGKWFENDERMCMGFIDEETEEVSDWSFIGGERWSETVYDSGFIKSNTWVFYDSGKPRSMTFYPEGAKKLNQWNRDIMYFENGQVSVSRVKLPDGSQHEKSYFENGKLSSEGSFYLPQSDLWPVTNYHLNGQLMSKGFYGAYIFDGQKVTGSAPNGKWLYWNNKGKLIAKAWFNNGEIVKSKVKRRTGKSIDEINSLPYRLN